MHHVGKTGPMIVLLRNCMKSALCKAGTEAGEIWTSEMRKKFFGRFRVRGSVNVIGNKMTARRMPGGHGECASGAGNDQIQYS